jgi:hypothetical protein
MKRIALAMIATLSLGGCSTGYKWDTDRNGNVYLAGTYQRYDPDKAQAIGNELQSGASRFATGYSNASAQQPQHGSAIGYVGGQPVWINY